MSGAASMSSTIRWVCMLCDAPILLEQDTARGARSEPSISAEDTAPRATGPPAAPRGWPHAGIRYRNNSGTRRENFRVLRRVMSERERQMEARWAVMSADGEWARDEQRRVLTFMNQDLAREHRDQLNESAEGWTLEEFTVDDALEEAARSPFAGEGGL